MNELRYERYVKLPNNLLYDAGESLLEQSGFNYAIIPIMICIKEYEDYRINTTKISIKELIEYCGLKVTRRKNQKSTYYDFLDAVKFLIDKGLLKLVKLIDLDKLKPSDKFEVKETYSNKKKNFTSIKYNIAKHIMENSNTKTKLGILTLWCYLEFRKNRKSKEPKVCYPSYDLMQKELGIRSRTTISEYTDKLMDMRVLYYKNEGIKSNGNITKVASNYYSTVENLGDKYYSKAIEEVKKVVHEFISIEVSPEEQARMEAMEDLYGEQTDDFEIPEQALRDLEEWRLSSMCDD